MGIAGGLIEILNEQIFLITKRRRGTTREKTIKTKGIRRKKGTKIILRENGGGIMVIFPPIGKNVGLAERSDISVSNALMRRETRNR